MPRAVQAPRRAAQPWGGARAALGLCCAAQRAAAGRTSRPRPHSQARPGGCAHFAQQRKETGARKPVACVPPRSCCKAATALLMPLGPQDIENAIKCVERRGGHSPRPARCPPPFMRLSSHRALGTGKHAASRLTAPTQRVRAGWACRASGRVCEARAALVAVQLPIHMGASPEGPALRSSQGAEQPTRARPARGAQRCSKGFPTWLSLSFDSEAGRLHARPPTPPLWPARDRERSASARADACPRPSRAWSPPWPARQPVRSVLLHPRLALHRHAPARPANLLAPAPRRKHALATNTRTERRRIAQLHAAGERVARGQGGPALAGRACAHRRVVGRGSDQARRERSPQAAQPSGLEAETLAGPEGTQPPLRGKRSAQGQAEKVRAWGLSHARSIATPHRQARMPDSKATASLAHTRTPCCLRLRAPHPSRRVPRRCVPRRGEGAARAVSVRTRGPACARLPH